MPQTIPDGMVESILGGQLLWWIKNSFSQREITGIMGITVEWGEDNETGARTCAVTARVMPPFEQTFRKAAIKATEPFNLKELEKAFKQPGGRA